MWDGDDVLVAGLLAPDHPVGCAIWFVLVVGVVAWLAFRDGNTCEADCTPLESRVLENECYCVGVDGSLRRSVGACSDCLTEWQSQSKVLGMKEPKSSFTLQPMLDGEPVSDHTADYWFWADNTVFWTDRPWKAPDDEKLKQDSQFCEDAIKEAGGDAYSLYVERARELPEGVVFRNDPQVHTGFEWALFDPKKRVS